MHLYSHFDVVAQETEILKITLKIPKYTQNRIMVLHSQGLGFIAIKRDLKDSDCPILRQSISKFIPKFENSPFPLSQSLCITRKE